jgi:uncharacterized membrane protein YfcA
VRQPLSLVIVLHSREGGLAIEIYILFFIAAIVGGAINALAGGGGLITFTLLILVLPPVTVDATSAVALVAGYPTAVWRTRDELTEAVHSRWLWLLLIPSVLGGLLGALLLNWSGNRNFVVLVPWLVLVATLLILLRPILVRQGATDDHRQPNLAPWLWPIAVVVTFVVALYGGYFGAGIGILVISTLSIMRLGGSSARRRRCGELGVRFADGARRSDRRLPRGYGVKARAPKNFTHSSYQHWFRGGSVLLLAIVRCG